MSIITLELVSLDTVSASTSQEAIQAVAEHIAGTGRSSDAAALFADAWGREQESATGMPGGFAIPHCRTTAIHEPTLAFARLVEPVDFGSADGPADLIFFIAAPEGANQDHLQILSALATYLMREEFVSSLRHAGSEQEVLDLMAEVITPEEHAESPAAAAQDADESSSTQQRETQQAEAPQEAIQPTQQEQSSADQSLSLVAVTSCPTGIAHTYMAADALKQAAADRNVHITVEPQGSSGSEPLPAETISSAQAVIFAADVDVRDRQRFAGKPVVASRVKRAIDDPAGMIDEALAAAEDPQAQTVVAEAEDQTSTQEESEGFGRAVQRVLMTGVSYMIPFVAAGGLLIALGYLLGGYNITDVSDDVAFNNSFWNLPDSDELPDPFRGLGSLGGYLGAVFVTIGDASMEFLIPALAGYIAFGMADRPGIAPGFTAGAVALTMDAGFIGGIIGGVLAGTVAYFFRTLTVPRWLAGLMPVVVIPLIATAVAAGLMVILLGGPIAGLTSGLENWLESMTESAAVALGLILGLMMCFDLGGPINKVAYSFAVAGVSAGVGATNEAPLMIMGTVMAAGMVPPLGMALATFLNRKLFTPIEQENGKTAVLLGAAFITEGAIPFAAADPLRVLPASMAGGAVTGAMTMTFGVTSVAPHGGFFVPFAVGGFVWFLLSVLAGATVTALTVIALKQWTHQQSAPATTAAP